MRLMVIGTLIVLALSSVGAVAAASAQGTTGQCPPGGSLLLVQTPADGFPAGGYADGLRVVDECGTERGAIDVPSPSIVWPMARPGTAIIYSGPIGPADATGVTYLVHAATLTATELDVPEITVAQAKRALYSLNMVPSSSHALVGAVGMNADIRLVDLATGSTTDVIANLPDDVVEDGTFHDGWIDEDLDAIVLQAGYPFDRVTAPLGDLDAAVRQPLAPHEPEPRDADGCVRSSGAEGGPGLFECRLGDGSVEWRVGSGGDTRPESIPELARHEPMDPKGEWSTASVVRSFFPNPTSRGGGWDDRTLPVTRIPFIETDYESFRAGFSATYDLTTMAVVDAPTRTVSRIKGLAAGRGVIRTTAPADGGRYVLVLWLPWSEEILQRLGADDPRVLEAIATSGQLYLVDLEEAAATLLDRSSMGALSPDGGSIAVTRLDVRGTPSALSIGLVGGASIEVGSGFGTWLVA